MISHTLIELSDPKQISLDKKEVLRYLGIKSSNAEIEKMIEQIAPSVYDSVSFKAIYTCVDINVTEECVDMGFTCVNSKALAKNLKDCKSMYVFAATLGIDNDRAIDREFKLDKSKASIFDCISTALIESFCDYVNNVLAEGKKLCPRFSPGYGDFSITHQKDVICMLDANKKIGIVLNDSYMMKPYKSVTAVIGIKQG